VVTATAALSLRRLTKSFGGISAVREVSFDIAPGEVVALAGENGAGKSTIKNMIGGSLKPDTGELLVGGEAAEPGVAGRMGQGVVTIHQEISLFPHLTVGENVMMNRLGLGSRWGFSRAKVFEAARPFLDRVGAQFAPDRLVGDLATGESQLVEIAKALISEPCVLVFDEPTASLTMAERERVFAVVRSLREDGVAVLYISHFLNEIFALSDRVVVMRDGGLVGSYPTHELDRTGLESLMVGRELAQGFPATSQPRESVALSLSNVADPNKVRNITFTVRHGEIFGLAGLLGAGRTELARAVFGLSTRTGEVEVEGERLRPHDPRSAIRAGIAFVTEDRREEGLFLDRPIIESLSIVQIDRTTRGGPLALIDRKAERAAAAIQAEQLHLDARGGLSAPGRSLSGGNQQKVAFGKWLQMGPRVLILDEPTRGIDVGAKAEIYRLLVALAADGMAIVLISSEMEELIGLSHRIGVMHDGRLQGVLGRTSFDPTAIIRLATGGAA